jgi:glycosyltransferase involved in cell wall biosynthesis
MKILYLTLLPPFDPARVATGNQVREAGIRKELLDAGHAVLTCAPSSAETKKETGSYFASEQELARYIDSCQPDAILVGYWTLLAWLPPVKAPVILDFIAPRLLETMFQEQGALLHESQQILSLLPRADHFLVGNQRQADLLLSLLLLGGIDCRDTIPISIVPISTSGTVAHYSPPQTEIRLVSAGVNWPWRQSGEYFAVLEAWCREHPTFNFRNITGTYPGAGTAQSTLLTYQEMRERICDSHIGLELGSRNTEREFSHSFRMIEYLQCGLPVIANAWLPVAGLLREYDAGWLVESPAELLPILQALADEPGLLAGKAEGARKLAEDCLNYRHSCQALLRYLQAPWQPAKAAFVFRQGGLFGVTPGASQSAPERGWKWRSALVQTYQLLFCRKRPHDTPDIVMVTRGDLFPTDHGAAVKIIRTAEALSRLQRKVYLCTDNRREYYCFDQGRMSVQRYPKWLPLLALPRRLALVRLHFKGFPWSNAFLYFPLTDFSYSIRALYLGTRFPVGAWIADFPAYVAPCRVARKLLGGRVLLVEHNVEYERLKAQIKNLSDNGFQELKRTELSMCQAADAVVTVSDNDKAVLLRDGVDPRKLHVIPHGVDLAAFHNTPVMDVRSQYGIADDALLLVYHGPYSYGPNLQAMKVMAQELLPRLHKLGLNVAVLAIGSKPPEQPLHPAIIFAGSVPDLAAVLPAADIAVVPLLEGGGTRMKILDYFAAGIPVISTQKGIEGIRVQHGKEALIVDDFAAICAAIKELAQDRQKARELVDNAAAFVAQYAWDAHAKQYLPLLFGP